MADVSTEIVMDEERGHYEVLAVGWRGNKRVHTTITHIDLINDKVWLQHDGTDRIMLMNYWQPVNRNVDVPFKCRSITNCSATGQRTAGQSINVAL